MGLREEIAKVRLARSRLEITRAKLQQLDEEERRLTRMLEAQRKQPPAKPEPGAKLPRRGKLEID